MWRRGRRWFSSWFRDYVYYPLVWSRKERGTSRIYVAIIITFLLTGVWHGAGWNFIIMGLLFGLAICIGLWTKEFREKVWAILGMMPHGTFRIIFRVCIIFILTSFIWIFFRASDLTQALLVVERLFTNWGDGSFSYLTCTNYCAFYELGIGKKTLAIAGISIACMFTSELFAELRLSPLKIWGHRIVRWPVYYVFILWMLFAGLFAPLTFIYFQF